MKWIRKYFFEIILSILGIAFATMLLYLILVMPEDLMVRGTVMFGLFFDAIAIYYTLRQLWRTKWRYRVMPVMQKIFEKIAKVLKLFREKLGIKEYRTVVNTGSGAGQTVFHIHVHSDLNILLFFPKFDHSHQVMETPFH